MATRGSIPTVMAQAGIDMLPAAEGIPIVGRELRAGSAGEVLIAGRLGVLLAERDAEGGLDPAAVAEGQAGPLVARLESAGLTEGLCARTALDPAVEPFLDHHRIDGTPVLPGVMGVEAFAELVGVLAGGRGLQAVEDVRFLAPFKFYRSEPRELEVGARLLWAPGDALEAHCALVGRRRLAGRDDLQETTHFTARLRLAAETPEPSSRAVPGEPPPGAVAAQEIYRIYFHGPAFQVLECAWRDGATAVGRLREPLPALSTRDEALVAAPRLVELCFQTAGVWEIGTEGRMGLPQHIARLRVAAPGRAAQGPGHAVVTPRDDGAFDAHVVDAEGRVLVEMEGYATAALPVALDADAVAPLRESMSA
jgi:hypothetical protein